MRVKAWSRCAVCRRPSQLKNKPCQQQGGWWLQARAFDGMTAHAFCVFAYGVAIPSVELLLSGRARQHCAAV